MKELSIAEKANRYDKAIETAKAIIRDYESRNLTDILFYAKEDLSVIFPELKESEDEKMMNQLHSWMKEFGGAEEYTEKVYQWIKRLLEKHKYTEEDLDKAYKCADEVQYRRGYEDAKKEIEKQGEQKPVDKVEQEYHCTGVREPKEATGVLKQLLNKENYAWSEEDEAYRVDILVKLEPHITDDNFTDVQNWIKSIKDRVQLQNRWNPNKEQIEAFEHFVRSIGESGYASPYDDNTKLLYSLLSDLKKLKC